MDRDRILSQAMKLSDADRLRVANDLLESVHGSFSEDVRPAWDAEIDRRIRQIEDGSVSMCDASAVIQRIRKRLNGSDG